MTEHSLANTIIMPGTAEPLCEEYVTGFPDTGLEESASLTGLAFICQKPSGLCGDIPTCTAAGRCVGAGGPRSECNVFELASAGDTLDSGILNTVPCRNLNGCLTPMYCDTQQTCLRPGIAPQDGSGGERPIPNCNDKSVNY